MSKTVWNLDPMHSEVNFRVRHLLISTVSGKFERINSTVTTDGEDFTQAEVAFSADVASINTGVGDRDNHLRSDDFFNAEKFPEIRFKSTAISKSGNGYQVDGDLTVRDVTRPVSFSVENGGTMVDFYGNTKAGFELQGTINRKEFGLMWDAVTEAGGVVVSDEVKFQVNLQYAKA
ncbi:MAG: YceI family protein [Saprospiraceae bacterium]|nr:YceI family protein [Saprospiraceae bacterium]